MEHIIFLMCFSEFNLQGNNMQPNFTLYKGSYKVWQFHSGEVQVQVNHLSNTYCQQITGSILCSDDLMELLQLVEAIRYADKNCNIELLMPYCAYSRQDRRCNPGESFSLKIFANLINSCNFTKVTTYDNHSDVSTALINNCNNISVKELIDKYDFDLHRQYNFLISPDAGANKKIFDCSQYFDIPMIRADKQRDTTTGAITHTEVFASAKQLDGATVLIVDDICAGGRTFAELAKAIKLIQPNCTIHLFVTHGFFSNGFNAMKEAGISKFITTDSVPQAHTCNQLTITQF